MPSGHKLHDFIIASSSGCTNYMLKPILKLNLLFYKKKNSLCMYMDYIDWEIIFGPQSNRAKS